MNDRRRRGSKGNDRHRRSRSDCYSALKDQHVRQGWADAARGGAYPRDYDGWKEPQQLRYELGRRMRLEWDLHGLPHVTRIGAETVRQAAREAPAGQAVAFQFAAARESAI